MAATASNKYDEIGYIAVPPCLYGDEDDGLFPPPYLAYDQNLTSIKKVSSICPRLGKSIF
jgi:hypothetical protein